MGIMGKMQIHVYACSLIFKQHIDTKVIKKESFLHNSKTGYLMNERKRYIYNAK